MRIFTFLSFLFTSLGLYAQCTQPVWADEFNGNSIDASKWAFETGTGCPDNCGGWGNSELEYYTAGNNLSVSNGILTLKAIKKPKSKSIITLPTQRRLPLPNWLPKARPLGNTVG